MVDSEHLVTQWQAAHAGDAAARDALPATLEPLVRLAVTSRLRTLGSPPDLVDDLSQEVLIKISRSFHRCRAKSAPHIVGWVRVIAQRVVLDLLRNPGTPIRFGAVLLDEIPLPMDTFRTGDEDGRDPAIVRLCEMAVDAQRELSNESTQLLWYRLIEGTSLKDIGRIFGVHEGAIKRRFQRAIAALRRKVRARVAALPADEQHQLRPWLERWEA